MKPHVFRPGAGEPRGPTLYVVFSKDRPLQLDATLNSLELNQTDGEAAHIHVLYRASTPRYVASYRVLGGQHPRVTLHEEVDFKADLVSLLSGSTHVLFLVDDSMFVAEFSSAAAIGVLARDPALVGFSYRLGRNTTYCYTLDKAQQRPTFESLGAGLLSFDWTHAKHDFGYPFEVSSSLYRTADVLPAIERLAFHNPNTLEASLAQEAASHRATQPRLACYEQSVAVSVPANIVQTAWPNRVDGRAELTAEALLDRYERGDRVAVEHYRGLVSSACHQELDYQLVHDPTIRTVSVVIPCYDQAQYLTDAVRSVVAQTFTDWEIVVVDDGSPDDTAAVAGSLATEFGDRIRLVRQANAGLAAARNSGVLAARGRYILPLDADDMIEPTMLEETLAALESDPTVSFVYTDAIHFSTSEEHLVPAAEYRVEDLGRVNMPNYCALYPRVMWEAAGGYNPNMQWGYEDWDFWLACADHGFFGRRLPKPLFRYRVREGSMFSTALAHDKELRAQLRLNHPRIYGRAGRFRHALRQVLRRIVLVGRRAGPSVSP